MEHAQILGQRHRARTLDGAVGEELGGMLGEIVHRVHEYGGLDLGITPRFPGFLLHEADQPLVVVEDPVQQPQ